MPAEEIIDIAWRIHRLNLFDVLLHVVNEREALRIDRLDIGQGQRFSQQAFPEQWRQFQVEIVLLSHGHAHELTDELVLLADLLRDGLARRKSVRNPAVAI